jgi:hypothetical protein
MEYMDNKKVTTTQEVSLVRQGCDLGHILLVTDHMLRYLLQSLSSITALV